VIVKRRAEELGIHAEVLATRRDINELASRGEPAGETTSGWRAAELQAAVDAFKSD
jgi:ribonuclease D